MVSEKPQKSSKLEIARRTSLPVPSRSLNGNLDELIYFHNRLPLLMAVESQNPTALTKSDLADPPDT